MTPGLTPEAEALRDILPFDHVPYLIHGAGRHFNDQQWTVIVRSHLTKREILDTLSPAYRARRLAEAEAYGIDLDEHDEIEWRFGRSETTKQWDFDEWVAYKAAGIPVGYVPVRMKTTAAPKWVAVREAAEIWGVGESTYRSYATRGYAPKAVRREGPGGIAMYDRAAVIAARDARAGQGARTDRGPRFIPEGE